MAGASVPTASLVRRHITSKCERERERETSASPTDVLSGHSPPNSLPYDEGTIFRNNVPTGVRYRARTGKIPCWLPAGFEIFRNFTSPGSGKIKEFSLPLGPMFFQVCSQIRDSPVKLPTPVSRPVIKYRALVPMCPELSNAAHFRA